MIKDRSRVHISAEIKGNEDDQGMEVGVGTGSHHRVKSPSEILSLIVRYNDEERRVPCLVDCLSIFPLSTWNKVFYVCNYLNLEKIRDDLPPLDYFVRIGVERDTIKGVKSSFLRPTL